MNSLKNFLYWDTRLLHRNNLFVLAAVVAVIYIGVFYLLKPLGDLTMVLAILIFNDPVVTGYLFAAVIILFDKNQNTIQALSILPVDFSRYLLSKVLLLSVLATLVAFIMTFATVGFGFNFIHLFVSVFFSCFMFACVGFAVGAKVKTFNQLLIYSIPIFILSAVPFISFAGVGSKWLYSIVPIWGGVHLLMAAFKAEDLIVVMIYYVHLIVISLIIYRFAVRITKNIRL